MDIFLHILNSNLIPLFLLVSVGILLQRKFKFDVKVFSKLHILIFVPAVIFLKIYELELNKDIVFEILTFFLFLMSILYIVARAYVKIKGLAPETGTAIINSILFFNSGNFGLPLIILVFSGDSLAVSVQIIIMSLQSISSYTLGVALINSTKKPKRELLKDLIMTPIVLTILLALLISGLNLEIPEPVLIPLNYLAGGFIPMALMTLGIQLANINWKFKLSTVFFPNFIRLLISPLIAFALVAISNISGTIAHVLIISSALPTALNVVLISIEYNDDSDLASQVVLTSTILSIFTLTGLITLVGAIN